MKIAILSLISFMLILTGCVTLPVNRVVPPWNRIMFSGDEIPVKSSISITVTGETEPLVGDENLIAMEIKDIAAYLLSRRGFQVVDSGADYNMIINYRTSKELRNVNYVSQSNSNLNIYGMRMGHSAYNSNYGLGVAVAFAIANIAMSSSKATSTNLSYNYNSYNHVIGAEIKDSNSEVIWKSDIDWDTKELDILAKSTYALQTVFASLPYDNSAILKVKKVKENKYSDYVKLKVNNYWFSSPALPYRTKFRVGQDLVNSSYRIGGVKNNYAVKAFADLLDYAEYALPSGSDKGWKNPLDPNIWAKVTLGGRYRFEDNGEPINVLITLYSDQYGYWVNQCSIVSDEEYGRFEEKLKQWRNVLSDYYDFYE
jgi:hypothetical protein